jgi:transposase-like protein
MASTRCGISAKQLERELGVTYKTAWRMFKLIRSLLEDGKDPLSGEVELDESLYGGKDKNRHTNKKKGHWQGKTNVLGMVERHGKVVARVLPDPKSKSILPEIKNKILPGTMVFSDEAQTYDPLTHMGYKHKRVHHAARVYVEGDVHTNTIEGFWSLTKNGIRGVYHAVSEKYLQSYLDEYAFRFNRRKALGRHQMFEAFLGRIEKKVA